MSVVFRLNKIIFLTLRRIITSGLFGLFVKTRKSFKKTGYIMEIFNCKYFTYLFHVGFCSNVCCFIAMYVSISLLRNVEGGDLSPYSSKKQRSVAPASLS